MICQKMKNSCYPHSRRYKLDWIVQLEKTGLSCWICGSLFFFNSKTESERVVVSLSKKMSVVPNREKPHRYPEMTLHQQGTLPNIAVAILIILGVARYWKGIGTDRRVTSIGDFSTYRVGSTEHLTSGGDNVESFPNLQIREKTKREESHSSDLRRSWSNQCRVLPYHGADRARGHVLDEAREERALLQVLVVLFQESLVSLAKTGRKRFESCRNNHAHHAHSRPTWRNFRATSLNPLRSKRPMISPTRPRWTPSGLIMM